MTLIKIQLETARVAMDELNTLIKETDEEIPDPLTDSVFNARDELQRKVRRKQMDMRDDATTDIDGREVSIDVTVAIHALRRRTDAAVVFCNGCESGMIQYWSKRSYVPGHVMDVAWENGYRVLEAGSRQHPDEEEPQECGYVELVPVDD